MLKQSFPLIETIQPKLSSSCSSSICFDSRLAILFSDASALFVHIFRDLVKMCSTMEAITLYHWGWDWSAISNASFYITSGQFKYTWGSLTIWEGQDHISWDVNTKYAGLHKSTEARYSNFFSPRFGCLGRFVILELAVILGFMPQSRRKLLAEIWLLWKESRNHLKDAKMYVKILWQ